MRQCFVISPIGAKNSRECKHAELVLNYIIKPALEGDGGFIVHRGDEFNHAGMITVQVVNSILEADLVVADLSFLNPNVFYELGLRHSTRKPTVHIASTDTTLPFDNADHRTIFYDINDWQSHQSARKSLKDHAAAIASPDFLVTNPVTIVEAHNNNRRQREVIESIGNWVTVLQDRLDSLVEEPEPGHITRQFFRDFTSKHRREILQIVYAIRARIDNPTLRQQAGEIPRVSEVLRQLKEIETKIGPVGLDTDVPNPPPLQ